MPGMAMVSSSEKSRGGNWVVAKRTMRQAGRTVFHGNSAKLREYVDVFHARSNWYELHTTEAAAMASQIRRIETPSMPLTTGQRKKREARRRVYTLLICCGGTSVVVP
jgi:hypothetical protein